MDFVPSIRITGHFKDFTHSLTMLSLSGFNKRKTFLPAHTNLHPTTFIAKFPEKERFF